MKFPQFPSEAGAKLTQASGDEDAWRFVGHGGQMTAGQLGLRKYFKIFLSFDVL